MRQILAIFTVLFFTTNLFAFSARPIKEKTKKKQSTVQDAVKVELSENSPFNDALLKILDADIDVSKFALIKAFMFLDLNHQKLKTEDLCFAKTNTKNKTKIRNLNCLIIADYSKKKTSPRLLFINPQTGEYEFFLTAHGKGSNKPEQRETGLSTARYSNVSGSNMTSLGFYLTDFLITSKKNTFGPGPNNGLMMDGISCTNSNARQRQIVAHTAMYVPNLSEDGSVPKVGNSEGCVTIPSNRKDVLKTCEHGALVYAYDNIKKHLTNYQKK